MSEQEDIGPYDDDNEYDMLSELNYYLTNELDGFKEEDENGYIFVNVIEMFEYMLTNNYIMMQHFTLTSKQSKMN